MTNTHPATTTEVSAFDEDLQTPEGVVHRLADVVQQISTITRYGSTYTEESRQAALDELHSRAEDLERQVASWSQVLAPPAPEPQKGFDKVLVTFEVEFPKALPTDDINRTIGGAWVQFEEPGDGMGGDADFRTGTMRSAWRFAEQGVGYLLEGGFIYCRCGNDPELEGYAACTPDGLTVDRSAGQAMLSDPAWEGHYYCKRCRQVIRDERLN